MTAILGIIAELLKLFNMIRGEYNDPAMVKNKIDQLHQDLKDHNAKVEAVFQNPTSTAADKKAALDQIRLIDS
jgi:outer membrane murein-binding lipoprotein Lpp